MLSNKQSKLLLLDTYIRIMAYLSDSASIDMASYYSPLLQSYVVSVVFFVLQLVMYTFMFLVALQTLKKGEKLLTKGENSQKTCR